MENERIKGNEKMDAILANDPHSITRLFEENVECFCDDISDFEFGEDEDTKKDGLAHIYKDIAYMRLICEMTMKHYGLNPKVLQIYVGKAVNKEFDALAAS